MGQRFEIFCTPSAWYIEYSTLYLLEAGDVAVQALARGGGKFHPDPD